MWNNYYTEVQYTKRTDKTDAAGNPVYLPPYTINVRDVSGGVVYEIHKDGVSRKVTKEYQIPFMVNEDDKIDNRIVISADASKDVFGNFHFCIVKVE